MPKTIVNGNIYLNFSISRDISHPIDTSKMAAMLKNIRSRIKSIGSEAVLEDPVLGREDEGISLVYSLSFPSHFDYLSCGSKVYLTIVKRTASFLKDCEEKFPC